MGMLKDESLDNVSGGVIFNSTGISGADPNNRWEVLDNHNGNVLGRYNNREDAIKRAKEFGSDKMNVMEVNWNQVQQLRGQA